MRALTALSLAFSLAALNLHAPSFAQSPASAANLTIIVPFAPGGTTDALARMVAPALSKELGRSVVVDNRAGANSIIGTSAAARSKGDGSTLVIGTSAMSLNHAFSARGLAPALPYSTSKDLGAVVLFGVSPYLLVVNADAEHKSVKDLVAKAKSSQQASYASAGSGGSPHLGGLLLSQAIGAEMLHVPYKGAGPAMTAVLAREVDFTFASYIAAKPLVDAGKLRILAIASKERAAFLPDVPTLDEQGVKNAEVDSWFGLLAPASTSMTVRREHHQALSRVLNSVELVQKMQANGIVVTRRDLQATEDFYQNDLAFWERFIVSFKGKLD